MNSRKATILILGMILTTVLSIGSASAQQPPASPRKSAEGSLGDKKVTLDYSAPSVRGRKIFGGLVPYDKVWRFGANKATHLTTDKDITIGNVSVPKGTYTLYAWPTEGGMKLIVNKQTGQWGTVYDEKQDLGRVDMKVSKTASLIETMNLSIEGGNLKFEWENTSATVAIK
jgi:hypothetical protein